ncbi:MAG: DNA cytosine methyltransferase [Clostridia bacterium]|nr:DNA cytosine methyltransferase [Clostridia bacterium]
MNVVSFFSGAGGLDLGYCLAGHRIIWANDFDEFAVETYNKNIGAYLGHCASCIDIVTLLDKERDDIDKIIPDCDIIIGGFPCQGFTIANLARSMEDDRNFLYLQLLKAISVKHPPFFQLENVKGLESINDGKVLPMIINDLENAGTINSKFFPSNSSGYDVYYNVINAYDFGVPQNRERVIILGIRKDIKKGTLLNHISNLPLQKNKPYKRLIIEPTHSEKSIINDSFLPKDKMNMMYSNWITGKDVHNMFLPNEQVYKASNLKDAIGDLPLNYSDDCNINNHTGSACKVKIKNVVGNRATNWEKRAPTIMGRGSGTGGPLIPPHPAKHRRLSVREVARIQTFPDDFVFYGSNSACYRQIGNAVPVLLAYNIALIFKEYEES